MYVIRSRSVWLNKEVAMKSIYVGLILLIAGRAFADSATLGANGIDSEATGLDGTGILIGQAETGRSGKDGYDDGAHSASGTTPTGVYFRTSGGMDSANSSNITDHATGVAGIMIGDQGAFKGIAPNAVLHSAALGGNADDVDIALTLNRLATLQNGNVRAININSLRPLQGLEEPNGNAHFTQFVDWSTRVHDVLYVIAWGNSGEIDEPRAPVDNYNGITVAASARAENESKWRMFGFINSSEGLDHSSTENVDILAPGEGIRLLLQGDNELTDDGTSYAAPHVTASVALLQQYSLQQIQAGNPRFNVASQRHEVMKAALMNAADKVEDIHGATRTVCASHVLPCFDWRQTDAFSDPTIPLSGNLGAGHLNVRRAVQQLASGEYNPADMIPSIGWDFGTLGGIGSSLEYTFAQQAGGYIAVTLAWDRRIESTGGTTYNAGDQFFNSGLANLDLRLVTADGMTVVAESRSVDMNLEHIFYNVESAGNYKIVVVHSPGDIGVVGATTAYGLAWWFCPGGSVPGAYNKKGSCRHKK